MRLNLMLKENIKNDEKVNVSFAGKNPHDWKALLSSSIMTAEQLSRYLPIDIEAVHKVSAHYPMRINPYYLSLIRKKKDAIWKQAVPDLQEVENNQYLADPLLEERQSPVPNLVHRYPDRVLLLVSNQCAMYCRYCMRKRKVGNPFAVNEGIISRGLDYLRKNKGIREVLLSGGDPLLLEDDVLKRMLQDLRAIPHIEIIRIHTRVPCTLPQRVTETLAAMLKQFHPIYINTHFNHPFEITDAAAKACSQLADAGIPLGSQTVLLKGVNDDPGVMKRLMQALLKIRIKPYYIHHADPVRGSGHFRTTIQTGLNIMRALRGYTSGLCVPDYMIDIPGGGGKVPLLPEYVKDIMEDNLIVENYRGETFKYPLS